jgi:hypothetical protein
VVVLSLTVGVIRPPKAAADFLVNPIMELLMNPGDHPWIMSGIFTMMGCNAYLGHLNEKAAKAPSIEETRFGKFIRLAQNLPNIEARGTLIGDLQIILKDPSMNEAEAEILYANILRDVAPTLETVGDQAEVAIEKLSDGYAFSVEASANTSMETRYLVYYSILRELSHFNVNVGESASPQITALPSIQNPFSEIPNRRVQDVRIPELSVQQ